MKLTGIVPPKFGARNEITKVLTFEIYHLRKKFFNQLYEKKVSIYDTTLESLHTDCMLQAEDAIEDGFSVIFTDGVQTKILQYNN